MVEYRTFRNGDPPAILSLWHGCGLGRGAAQGVTQDAFDISVYCQPYFDRGGLILAWDGDEAVGFVHAGFAALPDGSGVDRSIGVVCAVMVRPDRRRQGVGRELLSRAEAYLRGRGAAAIKAGPSRGEDPFYFGLYGGARPSGFLESDAAAAPFLAAAGYEPAKRVGVFQRNLSQGRDPTNFRIVSIRRKSELAIADAPVDPSWWWYTHEARFDTVRFRLMPKVGGGPESSSLTVIGLDCYLACWGERSVGLTDLFVAEENRGKGYAQALVIEVIRRLRQELVTRVEMHAPEESADVMKVVNACGFERVDTGVVYAKR